jgi:hypothetical protein
MKLNRSQPFGTIVGHEWARHEQNGILFDSDGNARETEAVINRASRKSKSKPDTEQELKIRSAVEFLKTLLSGGPMEKPIVYREAQNNNQVWEHVRTAFARLRGQEIMRGEAKLWKLLPEFAGDVQ